MAKKKQSITWTNERRKLAELIPWELNPRTINNAQAERLVDSVETFGQVETLAVGPGNELYNGHQRLSVLAGQYGMDYEVDVRVASRPLTERERQQLTVYLHKGAAGEFDMAALADWDMDDLLTWGFAPEELGMGLDDEPATAGTDTEPQIDRAEELRAKWNVELGQLWQLGDHRIICGDCTDPATVARVMGGEKADMVFTDPPYGVDYSGGTGSYAGGQLKSKTRNKIDNDADCALYGTAFALSGQIMDYGPAFVWYADKFAKQVFAQIPDNLECRRVINWYKVDQGFGDMGSDYHCVTEPCLYLVKGKSRYVGANNETNVWELQRPQKNELHPTQKPVELAERAIGNHDADLIVDFFLGSGSTLIAAQNKKRRCYGTELNAGYVAVILQRFADHTGIEPKLIESSNTGSNRQ